MNEILKQFINENIDLINKNTKESWEEIYEKLYFKIKGDFTKVILDAGINDPASKLGYIPEYYLYSCNISEYKIPDNVTSIGSSAFYNCDSLTSVVIGDSATTISDYAFYNCSSLMSINIPDSVISIGRYAIAHCSSLTSIVIPDGVTSIDGGVFYDCDGLTEIKISNSITAIASSMFSGCSSLMSVVIPSSVTSIDEYAFLNCSSLKEIHYKGTKKQAITKLKVKNKKWREYSSIEKIICSDGEILL